MTLLSTLFTHATERHAQTGAISSSCVRRSRDHNGMRGSNTRAVLHSRTTHNVKVLLPVGPPQQPNLPIPNLPEPRHIPARHPRCSKAAAAALGEVELLLCCHAIRVVGLGCSRRHEQATDL